VRAFLSGSFAGLFFNSGKQPSMALGAGPHILVRAFVDARDAPGIA